MIVDTPLLYTNINLLPHCYIDEIIRQETLNCTERGHLLIQIRDEMKMTIKAYQELNESVIGNWIRKTLLVSVDN